MYNAVRIAFSIIHSMRATPWWGQNSLWCYAAVVGNLSHTGIPGWYCIKGLPVEFTHVIATAILFRLIIYFANTETKIYAKFFHRGFLWPFYNLSKIFNLILNNAWTKNIELWRNQNFVQLIVYAACQRMPDEIQIPGYRWPCCVNPKP